MISGIYFWVFDKSKSFIIRILFFIAGFILWTYNAKLSCDFFLIGHPMPDFSGSWWKSIETYTYYIKCLPGLGISIAQLACLIIYFFNNEKFMVRLYWFATVLSIFISICTFHAVARLGDISARHGSREYNDLITEQNVYVEDLKRVRDERDKVSGIYFKWDNASKWSVKRDYYDQKETEIKNRIKKIQNDIDTLLKSSDEKIEVISAITTYEGLADDIVTFFSPTCPLKTRLVLSLTYFLLVGTAVVLDLTGPRLITFALAVSTKNVSADEGKEKLKSSLDHISRMSSIFIQHVVHALRLMKNRIDRKEQVRPGPHMGTNENPSIQTAENANLEPEFFKRAKKGDGVQGTGGNTLVNRGDHVDVQQVENADYSNQNPANDNGVTVGVKKDATDLGTGENIIENTDKPPEVEAIEGIDLVTPNSMGGEGISAGVKGSENISKSMDFGSQILKHHKNGGLSTEEKKLILKTFVQSGAATATAKIIFKHNQNIPIMGIPLNIINTTLKEFLEHNQNLIKIEKDAEKQQVLKAFSEKGSATATLRFLKKKKGGGAINSVNEILQEFLLKNKDQFMNTNEEQRAAA
jgi:hypothetical protein